MAEVEYPRKEHTREKGPYNRACCRGCDQAHWVVENLTECPRPELVYIGQGKDGG